MTDTSVITNLAAIHHLKLLFQLYDQVTIPEAVYRRRTEKPLSTQRPQRKDGFVFFVSKVVIYRVRLAGSDVRDRTLGHSRNRLIRGFGQMIVSTAGIFRQLFG